MATRSQVPYFCKKLPVLSPATDFGPPSESDFLLLADERADDLRVSLGAEPRKSLKCDLKLLSVEWTDEGPLGREAGLWSTGVTGADRPFLEPLMSPKSADDGNSEDRSGLVPDILGALLGGWLGGLLGGRVGGALHGLSSDGEGELVGDDEVDVAVEPEACSWIDGGGRTSGSKPLWALPASRNGML
jgi:hypothetical protein